jgi:ParB family chromosome partitioning protein
MSSRSKPVAQLRGRPATQMPNITPLTGAILVPIDQITPDDSQPRKDWQYDNGQERLAELANSIREFGVLQPLLVRPEEIPGGNRTMYRIIAGGRRYVAAKMAGLDTLPVVVRGEESGRIRRLQLIENLQRQNLSPLDEARAYQELIDNSGLTSESLAETIHVSGQHVRERLRLLADQVLADAVERRQISATAARDIMRLPDEEIEVFKKRVRAGEALQSNDVAAARARLAAAGTPHPRRKGGGRSAISGLVRPDATVLGPNPPVLIQFPNQTISGIAEMVPDQASLDPEAVQLVRTVLDDSVPAPIEQAIALLARRLEGSDRDAVLVILDHVARDERDALQFVLTLRDRLRAERGGSAQWR